MLPPYSTACISAIEDSNPASLSGCILIGRQLNFTFYNGEFGRFEGLRVAPQ
jgi:hypothetical protein